MIQRRRPIESAIAERKMFNMGGMAVPMPQPTYMDLIQQGIMGMPQQPQGIMASSQPLVDAIAADANNPAGGDTLSMAQGGVAKFQLGGLSRTQSSSMALPYATPQQMAAGQILADEQARLQREADAAFTRQARIRELAPQPDYREIRGDPSRSRLGSISQSIGNIARNFGLGSRDASLTSIPAAANYLTRVPSSGSSGRPSQNMEGGAAKFLARVDPELKPLVSEVINQLFGGPASNVLKDASQEEVMGVIAQSVDQRLSMSKSPDQNIKMPDVPDPDEAARQAANAYLKLDSSGDLTGRYGGDENTPEQDTRKQFLTELKSSQGPVVSEKAEFLIAQAKAPSNYFTRGDFTGQDIFDPVKAVEMMDMVPVEMLDSVREYLMNNPDATVDNAVNEVIKRREARAAEDAVSGTSADSTSEPSPSAGALQTDDAMQGPLGAAGDDSDAPRPKEKPPIPQGPFDVEGEIDPDLGLLVGTEAPASDAAAQVAEAPASDAAAQVAEAFDKPMTKPEATKTIQDYKNKFLEAMPEYEGVSEEEKGYRFIEAGLRVMAGQSSNAIENIATGLKGLGAEFAKDEKEKRAYDRQVDLSAAKYSLEGIQRDEVAAQALAKEKRGLFNKVFVVRKGQSFEYNGKMYEENDRIIPTVGSLQDGTFPIDAVSSEAFSLEQIKRDAVALKAKTDALFNKVEPPSKFVSSQIKYIEASTQIKANVAISNLLKEAVVPLQAGKVTGGLNALKTFAQRIKNFTGLDIPYADETPDAYRDKVSRAITANITSLLNEGNRTVSDADRTRAEQIGGLYADNLLAPSTKSANLLTEKLRAFEESIQRNNSKNVGIMSGVENAWNGTLNNALVDYGDILRKSRGSLGSTAERATPGSKRTVKWTDIISVDPDNPNVLNYKSDWFTK